jgi:hypothetical protein
MMRFLRWLFPPQPKLPRPKPKYIGYVHAITRWEKEDGSPNGETHGYWVLTEKAGGRHAALVGFPGNSPYAVSKQAAVEVWLAGGPLPDTPGDERHPPKPHKSLPKKKSDGNVVEFRAKEAGQ